MARYCGHAVVDGRLQGCTSDTDPVVSPLFGKIQGLPPILLLCGTNYILCANARWWSARAQGKDDSAGVKSGVKVTDFTYVEGPRMLRVFPLLPHLEEQQAKKLIMAFASKHLAGAADKE